MKTRIEILESILSLYSIDSRYLQNFEISKNKINCYFCIERESYLNCDSKHFNSVSSLIAYNQMVFVYYFYAFQNDFLNINNNLYKITLDDIPKMFILRQSVNYKRLIDLKQSNNKIKGSLEHLNIKKIQDLIILKNKFQFQNSFTGEMTLGIKLNF